MREGMNAYKVRTTRTVDLCIIARSEEAARVAALDVAWDWTPAEANGGNQGRASAEVVPEEPET